MTTASFEHTLESLLRSARRADELSGIRQGLEFADERGWLDEADSRRLETTLAEERIEREAFAKARYLLASAWRDEWHEWLSALCERLHTAADASTRTALETLRAETEGRETDTSLVWALCFADRMTTT